MGKDVKKRCDWCLKFPDYIEYHDNVWGVPEHNDKVLFEMLNLEGAQAGLNWYTVLKKQENYRIAFDNWNVEKISRYDQKKIDELLSNPGIIRNKLKVNAVVTNAKAYLKISAERSFSEYIWSFVNNKTIVNSYKSIDEVPATTKESDHLSKALKKDGFKFVGSTICYAFMQACGMVDDHVEYCFKRNG